MSQGKETCWGHIAIIQAKNDVGLERALRVELREGWIVDYLWMKTLVLDHWRYVESKVGQNSEMTAVLNVENWMSGVPFKSIFGKLWEMEKGDFFAIMLTYKHHTIRETQLYHCTLAYSIV